MNLSCKLSKKGKTVLITAFILVAAAVVAVVSGCSKDNDYSNEKGFEAFADGVLKEHKLVSPSEENSTSYCYGEDFSYAVRREICSYEKIDGFISSRIDKLTSSASEESITALVVDSAVRETANGAVSLMIAYSKFIRDDDEVQFAGQQVETFLFKKDGTPLEPLQVLNVNYRAKASEIAEEYFLKTYDRDERSLGWRLFADANYGNYNRFLMDGNNISFFFNEENLLKSGDGIITVNIGPVPLESSIRPEILDRYIDASRPMVAITYDDGPGGDSEASILDTLQEYGCVATFFYQGYRLEGESDNALRAVKLGCEIGNHSWDHPLLSTLTDKEVKKQINRTNSKIEEICGVEPVVARPPYGDFNKRVAKLSGMAQILWTIDTLDWKTRNAKKVFNAVKKSGNLDGKIILMHSIYKETAQATKLIVPWLKQKGYQTVTVSEMIQYKTGHTPKAGAVYRKMP